LILWIILFIANIMNVKKVDINIAQMIIVIYYPRISWIILGLFIRITRYPI